MKPIECSRPVETISKTWLLTASISSMPVSCWAVSPTPVRRLSTPFAFRGYQDCCLFIRTQVLAVPLASRLSIAHTGDGGGDRERGQERRKYHPEFIILLFHSSKRPFYLSATSASSLLFRSRALMQCPSSHATARWQSHLVVTGWTEWAERLLFVKSDRKQRRCPCVEELQRRFFLQEGEKNRLKFPLSTKQKMMGNSGWNTCLQYCHLKAYNTCNTFNNKDILKLF